MHHLTLSNNEFEGNNSIYLLGLEAGPLTLVDTGVSTPAVRQELEARLAEYDVDPADLDQILLTHWHHDHAGLVGALQEASGASVYVHEADAPLIRQDADAIEALQDRQFEALTEWGMPAGPKRELLDFLDRHSGLKGTPAEVTVVTDGDRIDTGEFEVEVIHLPGHAAGLVAYQFSREGRPEAFLGDSVLPKYTPNVGGADIRVDQPLAAYISSLHRVIEMDLDRAWPGHRGPLIAPSARARDIIVHHEDRTARVLRTLRDGGAMTAWEVSAALFGALKNIHILHGPGEAYAHLEHLLDAGLVRNTGNGYETVGDPSVEAAVESLHA